MAFFAGYGFNKSHSAAYALVAYHTAWLKAHHPGAFHGGAADERQGQHGQARQVHQRVPRDGDRVLPPDVNTFRLRFHGRRERDPLRPVGDQERRASGAIRSILEAREDKRALSTRYTSLCASVEHATGEQARPRGARAVGIVSILSVHRRSQLVGRDRLRRLDCGQKLRADREAGQTSLFGGGERGCKNRRMSRQLPESA